MEKKQRDRKNVTQNILIVLLSISSILLFLDVSNVFSDSRSKLSSLFSGSNSSSEESVAAKLSDLAAPVNVAVTGAYGRYGNLALTTTDENFSALGTLLREALGSSDKFTACTKNQFRSSLSSTSIFYDFQAILPLPVLGGLVGASVKNATISARRVILCAENNGVKLYFSDGTSHFCCSTQTPKPDLAKVVNHYQLGNAAFAFELGSARDLAPYSLFLTGEQPAYSRLTAANPLNDITELLKALEFNPHTNNRYTDSDGAQVIMDGNRTLRIQTNGLVTYQDEDGDVLHISASGSSPTAREAILGCYRLLVSSGGNSGNANLFLKSYQSDKNKKVLQFDYQYHGTQICRSNGTAAAQIVLYGTTVSSLQFYIRRYLPSGKNSLLLPLRQAIALSSKRTGKELKICYADSGLAETDAGWQTD